MLVPPARSGGRRRTLQVLYGQVAKAGHHFRNRLRQRNTPQGLSRREIQRLSGLMLRAGYGLYGTTYDLGSVGADIQCQGKRASHHWRQAQVDADRLPKNGQGKVQPKQLNQQRGAPEYFNEEDRDAFDGPVV